MHRHQKEEAPLHKTTINVQTKHFTHSSQTINRCCLSSSIGAKKAEAFIRIDAQPCAFHGCVILISLREGPSRMSTQLKACTFRRLNSSRSGSPDFCPRCPPLNLFVSSDSSLEAEISESPDPSAKLKHTIWYMHDKKRGTWDQPLECVSCIAVAFYPALFGHRCQWSIHKTPPQAELPTTSDVSSYASVNNISMQKLSRILFHF